jgi:hypothetical protein
MEFIEKAIIHTYDLLVEFNKIDDCRTLLDGSINMLLGIKNNNHKDSGDTKKSVTSIHQTVQNNLPLEFALSTCYLLKATLQIKELAQIGSASIDEQEPMMQASFDNIDKFESQLHSVGCNQSHLIRLLSYSHLLQAQITNNMK